MRLPALCKLALEVGSVSVVAEKLLSCLILLWNLGLVCKLGLGLEVLEVAPGPTLASHSNPLVSKLPLPPILNMGFEVMSIWPGPFEEMPFLGMLAPGPL